MLKAIIKFLVTPAIILSGTITYAEQQSSERSTHKNNIAWVDKSDGYTSFDQLADASEEVIVASPTSNSSIGYLYPRAANTKGFSEEQLKKYYEDTRIAVTNTELVVKEVLVGEQVDVGKTIDVFQYGSGDGLNATRFEGLPYFASSKSYVLFLTSYEPVNKLSSVAKYRIVGVNDGFFELLDDQKLRRPEGSEGLLDPKDIELENVKRAMGKRKQVAR